MTNDELITKFNPANVGTLSEDDLKIFRELTTDEIGVLAKAYPNTPSRRPYLVLYDHKLKADKQLFALSTYQNLYNVRKFSNMTSIVPYDFKGSVFPVRTRVVAPRPGVNKNPKVPGKKIVVDLSAGEAAAELSEAIGGPKKTSTPVVNIKKETVKKSSNPAQDAIDKATKKKVETKKIVYEKATNVQPKTRGKIQVDLGTAETKTDGDKTAAEPGAE